MLFNPMKNKEDMKLWSFVIFNETFLEMFALSFEIN